VAISSDEDIDMAEDVQADEAATPAPAALDPTQPEIRFMQKKSKRESSARLPTRYLQEQPVLDVFETALNPQVNQTMKKSQKLKKKLAKREHKRGPAADVDMDMAAEAGAARPGYDFAEHFGALPEASDSE
jgi:hypothetical protein